MLSQDRFIKPIIPYSSISKIQNWHPDQEDKIADWDKVIDNIGYTKMVEKLQT